MNRLSLIQVFNFLSNIHKYVHRTEKNVDCPVLVNVGGKTFVVTSISIQWNGLDGDHVLLETDEYKA